MKIIRVDKYTLLKLEDQGKYGFKITEGWENREGKFQPNFCKRVLSKDGEEKTIPVSIKLGNRERAREVLGELLEELVPF